MHLFLLRHITFYTNYENSGLAFSLLVKMTHQYKEAESTTGTSHESNMEQIRQNKTLWLYYHMCTEFNTPYTS